MTSLTSVKILQDYRNITESRAWTFVFIRYSAGQKYLSTKDKILKVLNPGLSAAIKINGSFPVYICGRRVKEPSVDLGAKLGV